MPCACRVISPEGVEYVAWPRPAILWWGPLGGGGGQEGQERQEGAEHPGRGLLGYLGWGPGLSTGEGPRPLEDTYMQDYTESSR